MQVLLVSTNKDLCIDEMCHIEGYARLPLWWELMYITICRIPILLLFLKQLGIAWAVLLLWVLNGVSVVTVLRSTGLQLLVAVVIILVIRKQRASSARRQQKMKKERKWLEFVSQAKPPWPVGCQCLSGQANICNMIDCHGLMPHSLYPLFSLETAQFPRGLAIIF